MTGTQSVKLYRLFQRLTKNDAEAQAFVEEVVNDKFEQKKEVLARKADVADVRQEVRQPEFRMTEFKAEIIKWMFIFWAGSIMTIIGAFYGFLNRIDTAEWPCRFLLNDNTTRAFVVK